MKIEKTTKVTNIISGVAVSVHIDQEHQKLDRIILQPIIGNGHIEIVDVDFFMEQFSMLVNSSRTIAREK